MSPFNTRAIAAHRDACEEADARRDMEAHERSLDEERIREKALALAMPLADLYEAADETHVGGDEAIEWALDEMERERRHKAHLAEIEAQRLMAQPPKDKLASDRYAAVLRARHATPDKENDRAE